MFVRCAVQHLKLVDFVGFVSNIAICYAYKVSYFGNKKVRFNI